MTTAQETTLFAMRMFARSGSYTDPALTDARILIAAQGYGPGVALTTDGRPFTDMHEALAHQADLDGPEPIKFSDLDLSDC